MDRVQILHELNMFEPKFALRVSVLRPQRREFWEKEEPLNLIGSLDDQSLRITESSDRIPVSILAICLPNELIGTCYSSAIIHAIK